MVKVNSCNCGFSFDVIEVHNDHVVKQCPMCDQIMCEEIEPRKPFDISEHEWSDENVLFTELCAGRLFITQVESVATALNKADAIAIAKSLGVTWEDLR